MKITQNVNAYKDFNVKKEINYVIENLQRLKKIMNRIDLSECEDCNELLWGIFFSIESLEEALYKALSIIEDAIYKYKEDEKNEK